jgi:hypothetical protein
MHLQEILSYLIPTGGGTTLALYAFRAFLRHRQGKLTRAELMNSRAEKAEKLAARYLAFIWILLAVLTAHGIPHPKWPRGLKPKD